MNMNESTIWKFFKGKGLNDFAIAGLMGNLYAESALRSDNLQNSCNTRLGYSDTEYTKAVDNGTYTNFVRDSAGYGLAQWTYWSRKEALLKFAKNKGTSIGDLNMQLEYLWKELQGYKKVMDVLNTAKSVLEASNAVLLWYEQPADQSESVQKLRASYGEKYYNIFADKTELPKEESYAEYYTVKKGDTLSKIAAMYGTTYKKLAELNGIKPPYTIYVGQKIKISDTEPVYHIVQKGESLSKIAAKYGTTYQKLAEMNKIADPNKIYVGQKLRVK